MTDARFEDAREAPLHLKALEPDDVPVIAALAQDAVFPAHEMTWQRRQRRFALLLNRFRWEDQGAAGASARDPERVQAVLVIDGALKVLTQGIDRSDKDLILSLLTIAFEPGEDGAGKVVLTLAGDGAVSVEVEALDITLKDVTRPYIAPSRRVPDHP